MKINVIDRNLPERNDIVSVLVALEPKEFRAVTKAAISSRRAKRTLAKVGIV